MFARRLDRFPCSTTTVCALVLCLATVGCGGDDEPSPAPVVYEKPSFTVTKVKIPMWEIVDVHRFSAALGDGYSNLGSLGDKMLPPPNHQPHPMLGLGPGTAHPGPYDHELGDHLAMSGLLEERPTYTQAEMTLPQGGLMEVFMVIPTSDAPMGKSPDAAAGPIIPNTVFPIQVRLQAYIDGIKADMDVWNFDVPALDATLDPPFAVDGHSHFPIFLPDDVGSLPKATGVHEMRGTMLDAGGNGWEITSKFAITP